MADLSSWIPFAVAVVGVAGTWGSGAWALRIHGRRDDARALQDRQRQKDAWDREDRLRTFERRTRAYEEFAVEWHRKFRESDSPTLTFPVPEDFLRSVWDALEVARLYISDDAQEKAEDAVGALQV